MISNSLSWEADGAEANYPLSLVIYPLSLSFSCFKKAMVCYWPLPELDDDEVVVEMVVCKVTICWLSLSFSLLNSAIVCSWPFPVLEALEIDDCKVVIWRLSLSFSCLKKAIVLASPFDEVLLDLKVLSYLVILSFSCLKRAIVCSLDPLDEDLCEFFSISTILSLNTSISLSLSLNKLWILFQSFPDPTKSPIILTGYSSLTTKSDFIHCPSSVNNFENADDPEKTLLPSVDSYKVLTTP